MSGDRDAELTQELDALVAAKDGEQRRMRFLFAAGLALFVLAILARHHILAAIVLAALSITVIALGVRAHLRAAALRGQAMEKILAEAFRRAGQDPPKDTP
ncbi:MAG TPA: hypothetical protein VFF76_01395 [Holophagaceae bacterium]|nr:hypothetical protein [Holophagaceae bacterium]